MYPHCSVNDLAQALNCKYCPRANCFHMCISSPGPAPDSQTVHNTGTEVSGPTWTKVSPNPVPPPVFPTAVHDDSILLVIHTTDRGVTLDLSSSHPTSTNPVGCTSKYAQGPTSPHHLHHYHLAQLSPGAWPQPLNMSLCFWPCSSFFSLHMATRVSLLKGRMARAPSTAQNPPMVPMEWKPTSLPWPAKPSTTCPSLPLPSPPLWPHPQHLSSITSLQPGASRVVHKPRRGAPSVGLLNLLFLLPGPLCPIQPHSFSPLIFFRSLLNRHLLRKASLRTQTQNCNPSQHSTAHFHALL